MGSQRKEERGAAADLCLKGRMNWSVRRVEYRAGVLGEASMQEAGGQRRKTARSCACLGQG